MSTPSIHFYDTDTGYIHYVSEVVPKLECRVYDAVRTFEDALIAPVVAVQFIPNLHGHDTPEVIHRHGQELFLEGVAVSNRGVTFMDRIMKNSPFRDNGAWLNSPEGRTAFMKQREERLIAWRNQAPGKVPDCKIAADGQHRHGQHRHGQRAKADGNRGKPKK